MMHSGFLLLFEAILVAGTIIVHVYALDCSRYKIDPAIWGFSYNCSYLSISDPLQRYLPAGNQVYFIITTFIHECLSYACISNYGLNCTFLSLQCACCKPYAGPDPGFHASILAPNGETGLYQKNLDCTFPPYVPQASGLYSFPCNFTGYGMANTSKLVQIQVLWKRMPSNFPPLSFGVYTSAGSMSLPDCIWQWERGNQFPLNEYGVFRILLYDGYGNKISAATGGTERNIVAIDVLFQKFGTFDNETGSGSRLDVHTTWKLTYQIQYGFCVITVYCTSVGTYQMKIVDEHNRALGNTPTTFYVLEDEAWAGTRFIPPPAPQTYFLGDNSKEQARVGAGVGVIPTHIILNLLLTILLLWSTLIVLLDIPST